MELEQAVLEAIKLKLVDTFKKVQIKSSLEGREIVIRISIPSEIMQIQEVSNYKTGGGVPYLGHVIGENLDTEAEAAAKELLG